VSLIECAVFFFLYSLHLYYKTTLYKKKKALREPLQGAKRIGRNRTFVNVERLSKVQSVGFHLAVKKEFLTDRWLWLDVKKNKTKIDITVMIDLFVCYFFE
jgi:hypothetical protein